MGEQTSYSLSEATSENSSGVDLSYYDQSEFDAVIESSISKEHKASIFADLARFNTLYMISRAGSGHLGSSFSSMDIVTWIYLNILKDSDKYFSSKGHDAPGLYAVQTALKILPFEKIHLLRRLNGLSGHPDVNNPGSFTNTGSLGMGVSKAKGFIYSDNFFNKNDSEIFVLTGDGELQEGHFWESLVSLGNNPTNRITVIVDHNKIQSDTYVEEVSDLGDLEAKFKAFGWDSIKIDGHNFDAIDSALAHRKKNKKPLAIIADTIKGKGVSFMEHTSMNDNEEYYKYHSGAPNLEEYKLACNELKKRIEEISHSAGININPPINVEIEPIASPENSEKMIPAYSEAILKIGETHNVIALDADLVLDTGLIPFKEKFPDRFIECGIAEQDMVSQAGTIALSGLIPIVHSFACFLTTRASEQIYNNASQNGKVIYVGSLAGLLPAGPGHSHQAVRDFTGMLAMPGITIIEPVNANQVKLALDWAVKSNPNSTYIRLTSVPYKQTEKLNTINSLETGIGDILEVGQDITLITFGPIFSYIAFEIKEILDEMDISLNIISTSWINKIDIPWLKKAIGETKMIVTLENHFKESGVGSLYTSEMASEGLLENRKSLNIGIDELPKCGRNEEVLEYHGLTAEQISKKIIQKFNA